MIHIIPVANMYHFVFWCRYGKCWDLRKFILHIKGTDVIGGVRILPLPLYAVNIETIGIIYLRKFRSGIGFEKVERKFLNSFIGAYDPKWYLTNIRSRIYTMKHSETCLI